jgi:hypothetical protein
LHHDRQHVGRSHETAVEERQSRRHEVHERHGDDHERGGARIDGHLRSLACGARFCGAVLRRAIAASARTAARPNEIYIYILEGFKYVFLCEYDLSCV